MRLLNFSGTPAALLMISFGAAALHGQTMGGMDHSAHAAMAKASASMPAGQDAYATVAAVVAALEAD